MPLPKFNEQLVNAAVSPSVTGLDASKYIYVDPEKLPEGPVPSEAVPEEPAFLDHLIFG